MSGSDLVLVALSGVQRFIVESRTTADLRAGSEIVAELAREAARLVEAAPGARLVFPSAESVAAPGADGVPNRIAVLVAAGTGATVAASVVERLEEVWAGWAREVFGQDTEAVPGIPNVQWVCVPASVGDYAAQWGAAQRALAARKRVRDFGQEWVEQRDLCSLSPRWPAARTPPPGLRPHQRDTLSVPNWVKRRWQQTRLGRASGFPSASSIASAGYRAAVLDLLNRGDDAVTGPVAALHAAATAIDTVYWETELPGLPPARGEAAKWLRRLGGRWVYPEFWQMGPLTREYDGDGQNAELAGHVRRGARAATALVTAMRERGWAPPSTHLAVLVQDMDSMGRFLAGVGQNRAGDVVEVALAEHQRVSALLGEVAAAQRAALGTEEIRGVAVYAGGDDLLALVPAASALRAARACHEAVPEELPTASTGVLFFHHRAVLRQVLEQARTALEAAKNSSTAKHALAVGYARRSGTRELCVQPWALPYGDSRSSPIADLEVFLASDRAGAAVLSPGLLRDLERDEAALNHPGVHRAVYEAELTRLVARHHNGENRDAGQAFAAEATRALLRLGARAP